MEANLQVMPELKRSPKSSLAMESELKGTYIW